MKTKSIVCALFLVVGGLSFNSAWAQRLDGSAGTNALSGGTNPVKARYLVTYFRSQAHPADSPGTRSVTAISVTNQSSRSCDVKIEWFKGGIPEFPVCTDTAAVAPGHTISFCSRDVLFGITSCNPVCNPELTGDEGKAIVSSSRERDCDDIGLDARLYYTTGVEDTTVSAVSNPKIVRANEGNHGD